MDPNHHPVGSRVPERSVQEVKVWSREKRTLAPGHGSGRGDSWVGSVFHSKPSGP